MKGYSPPLVATGTSVVLVYKHPDPTDYLPSDELGQLLEGCKQRSDKMRRGRKASS